MNDEYLLDRVIFETRQRLRKAWESAHKTDSAKIMDRGQKYRGYCGLAQCIAGYALQDLGVDVRPIATQSLKGYWHGHAALRMQISPPSEKKIFLIDTTFIQFCGNAVKDDLEPGDYLRQSTEGRKMVRDLLTKGYAEITPERSMLYLKAFCNGHEPFKDDHDAYRFFRDPPPHAYHFVRDEGDDSFSRENLDRQGLLIPGFQP